MPYIPISKHRALSHINNPRAKEKDSLLLLYYEGEEMAGYLGVLPDDFTIKEETIHLGWLSCLWINPNFRGKGIAGKLVQESVDRWKGQIMLTEFTPAAKRLYQKVGSFVELPAQKGVRLYNRFDVASLLVKKNPKWKRYSPVLKFADVLGNLIGDLRFPGGSLEHVFNANRRNLLATEKVFDSSRRKDLSQRDGEMFKWMMDFPWLLSSTEGHKKDERYHFSSVDEHFEFIPTTLTDDKNSEAQFLFCLRNKHLQLPYFFCNDPDLEIVSNKIIHLLQTGKVNTFTTFHPDLTKVLTNSNTGVIYKKQVERNFMASKALYDTIGTIDHLFFDGDGDCAFT